MMYGNREVVSPDEILDNWDVRFSCCGGILHYGGAPFAWFAKTQRSVSLSSAEAEFFGAPFGFDESTKFGLGLLSTNTQIEPHDAPGTSAFNNRTKCILLWGYVGDWKGTWSGSVDHLWDPHQRGDFEFVLLLFSPGVP